MGEFTAHLARGRLALLVLGSLAFVLGGLWMGGVFGPPPLGHRSPGTIWFIGWVCVLFFGSCAAIGIKRLFDSGVQLHVGQEGIRYARWSDRTIPWSEIVEVKTWRHRGQQAIVLRLRHPAEFPGRGLAALVSRPNRALTGGDISISLNDTDRGVDEAMSAIARFRLESGPDRDGADPS